MGVVRRYSTHIAAEEAAQALRTGGIIAAVVAETNPLVGMGMLTGPGQFAVLIHDPSRREDAARLLAALETEPLDPEPGWEDSVGSLDLSRLDPSLEIPCTHCDYDLRNLPRSASGEVDCPECGGRVDVVVAIVRRHGPEAFEGWYPDGVEPAPDEIVGAVPAACLRCRYSLAGLPQASQCPRCGLPYSIKPSRRP